MTAGYRGDGLRAWKQHASGRTYYLYDGTTPVVELDSAGAVTATNTFGAAGLVSRRVGLASTFYTFDPQGGVTQRIDALGAVLLSESYSAQGVRFSGATADPFGYGAQSGYYTDQETGLQLLTFRYYDPQAGRFLTRDPIGYEGGINIYSYVTNNPVNFNDPLGLYPPSHPYCIALRKKIENIEQQIAKRIGERHEDKLGLPWRAPGDTAKPSLSRWGHDRIINELKAQKAALEGVYAAKCNDSEEFCPAPKPLEETGEERSLKEQSRQHMQWVYGSVGIGAVVIAGVVAAPAHLSGLHSPSDVRCS